MANPAIALQRLELEERIKTGCSHRAVIDYTDLTSNAGTSGVLTIESLKSGDIVNFAFFDVVKAFAGGSISACVAKLGVTGSDAAIKANVSVFGDVPANGTVAATYNAAATIAMLVTFTSTTDNLSALTQGKLFVYFNKIATKDYALQPLSAP